MNPRLEPAAGIVRLTALELIRTRARASLVICGLILVLFLSGQGRAAPEQWEALVGAILAGLFPLLLARGVVAGYLESGWYEAELFRWPGRWKVYLLRYLGLYGVAALVLVLALLAVNGYLLIRTGQGIPWEVFGFWMLASASFAALAHGLSAFLPGDLNTVAALGLVAGGVGAEVLATRGAIPEWGRWLIMQLGPRLEELGGLRSWATGEGEFVPADLLVVLTYTGGILLAGAIRFARREL